MCVSVLGWGVDGLGGDAQESMGALCAAEGWVCICVQVCSHGNTMDGWGGRREGRIGYGYELLSPHPCTRALGLREKLQSLREELERVAQKGRARRAQSAELNSDLCKAHRWVPFPCVSPGDLRSVPGSLWASGFPRKVGGKLHPSHTSPF